MYRVQYKIVYIYIYVQSTVYNIIYVCTSTIFLHFPTSVFSAVVPLYIVTNIIYYIFSLSLLNYMHITIYQAFPLIMFYPALGLFFPLAGSKPWKPSTRPPSHPPQRPNPGNHQPAPLSLIF